MSTASAGNSSDPPQPTSHQPGPLALLAASALGSALATRMSRGPLLLAAGAAAYALLKQKKPFAPQPLSLPQSPSQAERESPPEPEPPQEITPEQSLVEQWLSRQITREEQAPVIDLSTVSAATPEPEPEDEDDYRPQSFLIEDADEFAHLAPSHDSFARLMEPVPLLVSPPAPQVESTPDLAEPEAPERPVFRAMETPPASPAIEDAGWTLGVEPLPSLNESAPFTSVASSMFFTAPVQQEEPAAPPVFFTPVFEGAAFPDEIQVAPAPVFEPSAAVFEASAPEFEPTAHAPTFEPDAPLTAADLEDLSAAEEIAVELAAPGEASFDPPLAAAPENPWAPETDVPAMPFPAPVPSYAGGHVVEAEIILRPRAPMQNTVVAKSKFSPHEFVKKDFAETFDAAPVIDSSDIPQDLPPPTPSKSRTWRSWWRGD